MPGDNPKGTHPDGIRRNHLGHVLTITYQGVTYTPSSDLVVGSSDGEIGTEAVYRSKDGTVLEEATRDLMLSKYPK